MDGPTNLYGLDRDGLAGALSAYGVPAFHGRQLYRWLYGRRELRPAAWTDLPAALRDALARDAVVDPGRLGERAVASDGTVKYRVLPSGGGAVETVAIVHRERDTLCVSSQVGCALACDFCMTARMGLIRHLDAGEIVGQVALATADRAIEAPFNVVFMGMGEPLHNYDGVLGAFRILTDPDGFGLSRRRVTVSTSGLVPKIERLAGEPLRPKLAVSLNATTDEVRDRLMPVNRRWPIEALLAACREYRRRTGDDLTFEYVLLAGVNDGDADVERLAAIVRRTPAKINLIPFNAVPGELPYRPPARERVDAIRDALLGLGARASVRWSRGLDARAACGQLAVMGLERPPVPGVTR